MSSLFSRIPLGSSHRAAVLLGLTALTAFMHAADASRYDVVWSTPGASSRDSMPLGNGDIGVNVWIEEGGDLWLYLGKTDAWGEDVPSNEGLLKVGRVRVQLSPNPFVKGAAFKQTLNLAQGRIDITAGDTQLRIWVDANRPVIHIETTGATARTQTVVFESTRTPELLAAKSPSVKSKLHPDTVFTGQKNRVAWVYRNENTKIPELAGLSFGAIIQGEGFTSANATTLRTTGPVKSARVSIFPLTTVAATPETWLAAAEKSASTVQSVPPAQARTEHDAWWQEFWNRSAIDLAGTPDAEIVSRAYNLQRFVTACAGRGAHPVKFNGSLFTMDDEITLRPKNAPQEQVQVNGDFRYWGGRYWVQNTRHIYWPLLASGDFEMLQPFFKMYDAMAKRSRALNREAFGWDGAIIGECQPFYGTYKVPTYEADGGYLNHHFNQCLEITVLMLDYADYASDDAYLRATVIPFAEAGLTFYANYFKTDTATGRLVFEPCNAMETYWKTKNPSSDIAGFRYVLGRLLALPERLTTADQRTRWKALLAKAPDIPVGEKNGIQVILPAESLPDPKRHNTENPDLVPVFPFRVYGLGRPDLALAQATYAQRDIKMVGCWHHDVVIAARLGDTAAAQAELVNISTLRNAKDRAQNAFRFPAFWGPGHDYAPDQDHGGIIMNGLQTMLLQADGQRLLLFPAWPSAWNVTFKLRAPQNTVVEGEYRDGKLQSLKVTPASRQADVIDLSVPANRARLLNL